MSVDGLIPKGVVYTTAPPPGLSASIEAAVARAIAAIPADKSVALIGVATEKGANLVIAGRTAGGALSGQVWVGKSGWDRPIREGIEVGAQVVAVF